MQGRVIVGLSVVVFLFLMLGCRQRALETVDEARPYCVEVARERSIYQAQKIQARLRSMGVDSYIIESIDSVEREWYSVVSGAFADTAETAGHAAHLDSTLHLPGLTLMDSRVMADSVRVVQEGDAKLLYQNESKRIAANAPSAPEGVIRVVRIFPENNAFYLQRVSIANFEGAGAEEEIAYDLFEDMPRGVTARAVARVSTCLVEVQYQDNLYEDEVTLSIAKLKATATAACANSFDKYEETPPKEHAESYAVALEYSELILGSGDYEEESLEPIVWEAFRPLGGYKVGLMTSGGTRRAYYVLVDSECEYLIMAQSVQKGDGEMRALLEAVGRGRGLEQYDEYYNAFYLLPDRPAEDDIFLGFSIKKLDKMYAARKLYADWANALVGHWNVSGYYWNLQKGLWRIEIFDLLTPTRLDYVYGTLYTRAMLKTDNQRDVYGVPGHFVGSWLFGKELNFGYGRYICAIDSENFEEEDFMDRAERLQLTRGGYQE